jgi:hypothetical protein
MTAKNKHFGEVFDAHTAAEFQTRDIDATMATMGGAPYVTHVALPPKRITVNLAP